MASAAKASVTVHVELSECPEMLQPPSSSAGLVGSAELPPVSAEAVVLLLTVLDFWTDEPPLATTVVLALLVVEAPPVLEVLLELDFVEEPPLMGAIKGSLDAPPEPACAAPAAPATPGMPAEPAVPFDIDLQCTSVQVLAPLDLQIWV